VVRRGLCWRSIVCRPCSVAVTVLVSIDGWMETNIQAQLL